VTLISQRPAVLNKNVLTQIEVLIAHQITSPQDRSALDEWAKGWSTPTQRSEFLEGLARLKVGEAWIWSPTWLEVFKPITVRRRQTFDSSATPKAGEERTEPKVLADVDLDALKAAMADTVARAQADDPKILRAEIRRLEGELRAAEAIVLEQTEMARQPVPFVPPEVHDAIRVANAVVLNAFDDIGAAVREAATPFNLAMSNALLKIESVSVDTRRREVQPAAPTPRSGEGGSTPVSPSAPGTASARGAARPTPTRTTAVDRAGLDQAARKVLYVLAANGPTLSKRQIALLTGYSVKASTIGNAMSKLRAAEYVDGWTITDDGAAVAAGLTGAGIPPAGGPALLRYWLEHPALDQAARRVLGTLTGPPVRMWSKRDIANATGYSVEASTIGNALSKLRSLGLVDGWQLSREFEDAIR
jgi:alkylated DNA nucleotide flippase Atl1